MMSSFILSYEICGIRWNIVVVARSHEHAKSMAPKYASKVNAEWIP